MSSQLGLWKQQGVNRTANAASGGESHLHRWVRLPTWDGKPQICVKRKAGLQEGRRGKCPKERNERRHSYLLLEHNQDVGCSLICPSLYFLVPYRDKSRRFSEKSFVCRGNFYFLKKAGISEDITKWAKASIQSHYKTFFCH